jgi:hypothetical protein
MKKVMYIILGLAIVILSFLYLLKFCGFAQGINEEAKQKKRINVQDSVILNDSTILRMRAVDSTH